MAPRRASPEPHLVTLQRASADPSARARSGSHSSSSSSSSDGSGDEDTYVVESILRRRVAADGEYEYLVKWEGYEGDEATTWEPEENLNCQTLLRDFKHEQKQKELRKEREQEDRRPSSSKKSAPKRVLELDDGSDSDDEPLSRKAVNAKDKGKGKEKNSTSTEAPRKKAKAVAPTSTDSTKRDRAQAANKQVEPSSKSSKQAERTSKPSKAAREDEMPSSLRRQKKKKSNPFNDSLSDSDSSPNPPTVSSSSRVGPGVVGEKKQSAAPAPASPRDLPATPSLAPSSNSNSNILSKLPSFHRNKLDSRSKAAPSPPQPAPTSEPQKSNEVAVSPAPISTPRKPSPSFSIPASAERAAGPSKERITTAAASKASATASDEGLASPQRLDEAAEAKLAQRRQQERASEVAEAAEREKTNQIKYTNLEGLLKETKIFETHRQLFESRPMAAACAEIVGLPPTLLLTMKQRHCAFIQATPGDEEHDPEHWALGLCLLAAKAKSPPTIDHVEVVFIHRAASSTQISPILISLTAAERHVEFYAFGAGRPVQLIFPSGFAVVPTLAALQQAESLAAFLAFIARYPSSALKVHPATMTLGKVQLPQTWRTIVATVREHLVQQGELPPTSKLAAVSTDSVLSLDPRRPLPSVDSQIELDEIELFLTRLWEREPHRYRRYIIVHDRAGPGPLESKCMERGVEVMTWAGVQKVMERAIF